MNKAYIFLTIDFDKFIKNSTKEPYKITKAVNNKPKNVFRFKVKQLKNSSRLIKIQ